MEFIEIAGIKWATCNVGAEKPTDIGLYFQWGDRKGYTADEVGKIKRFNRPSYKHYNGKCLTKYTGYDDKHVLDLCDDAAFAYMGHGWRMPTKEDFRCLLGSTTHRWSKSYQDSGVPGRVFTDRTDETKELFFPVTGFCIDDKVLRAGDIGYYWTMSLHSYEALYAYRFYIGYCGANCCFNDHRCNGFPVRGILTT